MPQGIGLMERGDMPIWSAALVAAGCRARKNGESEPVVWQVDQDHARYAAKSKVIVEPFGVKLSAGEVLEVRWTPNDTEYRLTVKRPQMRSKRKRLRRKPD